MPETSVMESKRENDEPAPAQQPTGSKFSKYASKIKKNRITIALILVLIVIVIICALKSESFTQKKPAAAAQVAGSWDVKTEVNKLLKRQDDMINKLNQSDE